MPVTGAFICFEQTLNFIQDIAENQLLLSIDLQYVISIKCQSLMRITADGSIVCFNKQLHYENVFFNQIKL